MSGIVQPPDNLAFGRMGKLMLIALLIAGVGEFCSAVVPCDAQSGVMAKAADVGTIPEESVVVPIRPTAEKPTLGLKERYDVGEPCPVALLLPEGQKLIDVEWELPLRYIEPPNSLDTIYPYPIGVGSWPIRANYIVDIGGKLSIAKLVETLKVGDPEPPPPPKPLAELAAPKAKELAFVYDKLAGGLFTSLAHFRGVESSALADMGLADNAAVPVIRVRLEKIAPFDGTKLVAELKAIAKELGGAAPPPPGPTTATAAAFIYEKDQQPPTAAVRSGLNRLNREKKIVATEFEDDTTDGDDDVPDQYKVPLEAARQAGTPALVVTNGDKVLNVVKSPTTEQQVLEAVP